MQNSETSLPARQRWGVALQALDPDRVNTLAEELTEQYPARYRSVPSAGLGMLQMRDGALGERFHVGEFPCSSAHVTLNSIDDQEAVGGAHIMADDEQLAISIAICDAVLNAGWEGSDRVASLVLEGLERLEETNRERQAILARTTVDFALLNQTLGEENA